MASDKKNSDATDALPSDVEPQTDEKIENSSSASNQKTENAPREDD